MNLRIPCFAVALLSLAATGDPCSGDDSSSGNGATTNYGPNGAVCEVFLPVTCCAAVDEPCNDNNDCCTGNCSGSSGGGDGGGLGGGFGDAGSTCAEPANNECTVALSSRCNTGQCACASDNDCCLGSCVAAAIPGTTGHRCCLTSGLPCDVNADCCSLTCTGGDGGGSGQCE
jgi:hypothetical protein